MEPRPCPRCEQGTLTLMGGRGRCFPFKGMAELELPEDVLLPTCDHCKQLILRPRWAKLFDEGMQRAYQARISELIAESLELLTPDIVTQQELERIVGLSKGYVSKLKYGKESSRVVAAALGLLAVDPAHRLKELEGLWAGRRQPQPSAHVVCLSKYRERTVKSPLRTEVPPGRSQVLSWGTGA
jgi:hypothetical protein